MAKILRVGRKLVRCGGALVRATPGQPCNVVCDDASGYWKLTACDCSGGSTRFWSDTYRPSMGCVWASIDGDCYWICPDSENRETLPPLGVNKRPEFYEADSAEDACRICCGYGATDCCDENIGRCGVVDPAYPWVRLNVRPSLSLGWEQFRGCSPDFVCQIYQHAWNQPWTSKTVNPDSGIVCQSAMHVAEGDTTEQRTPPCDTDPSDWTNTISATGGYTLFRVVGPTGEFFPPRPLGFNDGREAVIGTTDDLTSHPAVYGRMVWNAGWFGNIGGFRLRFAVSMADPSLWWLYVIQETRGSEGKVLDVAADLQMVGKCQPRVVIPLDLESSYIEGGPGQCSGGASRRLFMRSAGSVAFDFLGIASCLDFGGGSGQPPSGSPTPASPPPAGAGDPNAAAIAAHQAGGIEGGCPGCGG